MAIKIKKTISKIVEPILSILPIAIPVGAICILIFLSFSLISYLESRAVPIDDKHVVQVSVWNQKNNCGSDIRFTERLESYMKNDTINNQEFKWLKNSCDKITEEKRFKVFK